MKILTIACKITNCYLLESSCGWIMIDTDWPGTLFRFQHLLKQQDIKINEIKYLIVTHFHPDHAGIAQDLKELGIGLVLHEKQVPFVDKLNDFFKRNPKINYKDIVTGDNRVVSSKESRELLKSAGINGEIISTPGHSDDSISLILEGCCAFTGDLPELSLVEAYDDQAMTESWKLIQGYNVERIYPAHGNSYIIR